MKVILFIFIMVIAVYAVACGYQIGFESGMVNANNRHSEMGFKLYDKAVNIPIYDDKGNAIEVLLSRKPFKDTTYNFICFDKDGRKLNYELKLSDECKTFEF